MANPILEATSPLYALIEGLKGGGGGGKGKPAPTPQPTPKGPSPQGESSDNPLAKPSSFKHGGVVEKTGMAKVHKGETVIPTHEQEPSDQTVSLHRALHHLNKGGLHRALGVKEGSPIPPEKLQGAMNSSNPHVKKMAEFAHTMEGWKH